MSEASDPPYETLGKRRAAMREAGKRGITHHIVVGAAAVVAAVTLFRWLRLDGESWFTLSALSWVAGAFVVEKNQGDYRGRAAPKREDLMRAIAAAQAFDLSPVTADYRARHGLSEAEAAFHEREFRRWAAFVSVAYSGSILWPVPDSPLLAYRAVAAGQPALFQALGMALVDEVTPLDVYITEAALARENYPAQEKYAELWVAYGFAYQEEPDPALWPRPSFPGIDSIRLAASAKYPGDGVGAAFYAALVEKPHQNTS
ncbi:hypothetical protein J5Y09_13940 [Roseomonas sp. PWR1]|uniref:Uncharacterized protein n=1 Tax=Roseomonas nitratireducens TaxID=2820810 RepID=A0ABS4AUI4_9PROT|nr:hypothetical protein [Neoroseomonas nitratireducens]MBP0465020.1 hypothetical protein [Neoroseomonas nitratireducens]